MTTSRDGEIVTSTYAGIYFDDDYCNNQKPKIVPKSESEVNKSKDNECAAREWRSPSDMLLGFIGLKPPLTSKLSRGITHQGILKIGQDVLDDEREKFLSYIDDLLEQSDTAWSHIKEQENLLVQEEVKEMYKKKFMEKSITMQKEINKFLESSLQEMEEHLRTELQTVITTNHANLVSDLNFEIQQKLKEEKAILENELMKIYTCEVEKIKHYYEILLHNEKFRSNRMINQFVSERNEALRSFYNQLEAVNTTSIMYVMCAQRKKCRMRKFLIETYHTKETQDKLKAIQERQEILNSFGRKKKTILELNTEWEDKIKKILQLFLKFISFSLKLLPEQSNFLLDLERLVVLQLNEIQKKPTMAPSLLVLEEDINNLLSFEKNEQEEPVCEGGPFVIEGDLADSIPTPHGSRETLPSHADLPFLRVQRQFIYAECQKMEEVRKYLESQRCKCNDKDIAISESLTSKTPLNTKDSVHTTPIQTTVKSEESSESSLESYLIPNVNILRECPCRDCKNLEGKLSFPNLSSYLDFNEANYTRIKTILGDKPKLESRPELFKVKDLVVQELPFSETKEPVANVQTQYSSQEELAPENVQPFPCPCAEPFIDKPKPKVYVKDSSCQCVEDVRAPTCQCKTQNFTERRISLQNFIHEHPNLLKIFTDESFDFQL